MPAFLERKLKKEYPGNPGAVYATMNKIGAMHGNKETAKGRAMEKKHSHHRGHKKKEMAKKMGHAPHHGSRHIRSQMKFFGGPRGKAQADKQFEDNAWKYARENRMSDKRIF